MTKNENEKFSSIDSKVRAAFTRAYNAGTHKSQALVAEQGVDAKKRKKVKKVKEEVRRGVSQRGESVGARR